MKKILLMAGLISMLGSVGVYAEENDMTNNKDNRYVFNEAVQSSNAQIGIWSWDKTNGWNEIHNTIQNTQCTTVGNIQIPTWITTECTTKAEIQKPTEITTNAVDIETTTKAPIWTTEATTEATTNAVDIEATTKAPIWTTEATTEATTKATTEMTTNTVDAETTTKVPIWTTETTTEATTNIIDDETTTKVPVTETTTVKETTTETTTNSTNGSYVNQVLELVNQERVSRGLSKLSLDTSVNRVAQTKAEDMANNNYFSHTSPTYGSPFDMLKQFGVSYRTAGENIAKGQRSPESVMDGWMNSEGHRANILNGNYTKLGVGYTVKNGTTYWVQMFIG